MGDLSIGILKQQHKQRKAHIQARLSQFKQFFSKPLRWTYSGNEMRLVPSEASTHDRFFEEMCFCIFAANTSAEMGMKTIDHVRPLLHRAEPEEMTAKLRGIYRFINLRPQYIAHTREYLKLLETPLNELVVSFADPNDLRDFLANNTGIRGLGYKEASHFLRNLGFEGFAILDKHIINSMHELGIIATPKAPTTGAQYLSIEENYLELAHDSGIDPDELDLLLWSNKTGKILK